jgi:hypothetical protein
MLTENGTKPGVDGSDLKATFPFGFGRVSRRTSQLSYLIEQTLSESARACILLLIRWYALSLRFFD